MTASGVTTIAPEDCGSVVPPGHIGLLMAVRPNPNRSSRLLDQVLNDDWFVEMRDLEYVDFERHGGRCVKVGDYNALTVVVPEGAFEFVIARVRQRLTELGWCDNPARTEFVRRMLHQMGIFRPGVI